MKKNRKKYIAVVAFAAILTSILATNVHTIKEAKIGKTANGLAIVDTEAILNSEEFKSSFEKTLIENYGVNYKEVLSKNNESVNTANKIQEVLGGAIVQYSSISNNKYPDFYGGMYINDNDELVVQLVEQNIPQENTRDYSIYKTLLDMEDQYNIEYVTYTYNDLEEINNKIISYLKSENNHEFYKGNYIDVINNKMVVELKNNTVEEQEFFKKNVINSNVVLFVKGKDSIPLAYNPGQGISSCSLGYRAKFKDKSGKLVSGFVTAGHCFPNNEEGEQVDYGYLLKKTYINAKADAAFVQTSTSITNTLQYSVYPATSITTSEYGASYVVGQKVGKVGGKTYGTAGTITAVSQNVAAWEVSEKNGMVTYIAYDLVAANIKADAGDSGGPLFSLNGASKAQILGIVQGGSLDDTNTAWFSKINNIKNELGATIY